MFEEPFVEAGCLVMQGCLSDATSVAFYSIPPEKRVWLWVSDKDLTIRVKFKGSCSLALNHQSSPQPVSWEPVPSLLILPLLASVAMLSKAHCPKSLLSWMLQSAEISTSISCVFPSSTCASLYFIPQKTNMLHFILGGNFSALFPTETRTKQMSTCQDPLQNGSSVSAASG